MLSAVIGMIHSLRDALLEMIYPRGVLCIICEENSHGGLICDHCRAALDELRLRGPVCDRCGMPLAEDGGCACGRLIVTADGMRSVWRHSGAARALVHALKHDCLEDAASVMAPALAEIAASLRLPPDTLVTSVAMPESRIRARGIDHGRELAQRVAEQAGLAYRPLLKRERTGHTQQGLGREARRRNLQGAFAACPLHGETVLLIDDVLTTGATAEACVAALRSAGCGKVYVITATRA